MLEASKTRHIDSFLSKPSSTLKNLQELAAATTEFPARQMLIYNLMRLTNDVSTFDTHLISYLAQDIELANLIIEKARIQTRLSKAQISATQLRKSIQRLGYGLVHNEIQSNFAKQYAKVYYGTDNEDIKTLLRRSIRLSIVSKELAKMIGFAEPTLVFFTGINYYLGELIIALKQPKSHTELEKMKTKGVEAKSAELAVLGFETGELAAKKIEEWKLPEATIDVIKNRRDPNNIKEANYKLAMLMRFSEYVSSSLSDKKMGPQAMWDKSYDYLKKLGVDMSLNTWCQEIRLMYIRTLETEHTLYQR